MHKGMSWEESMFAVFEDLEQQAEGLQLIERDAEVADLTVAEYSRVSLAARLHASLGLDLRVRLVGGHMIVGRLSRMGDGWLLLVDRAAEWIVRSAGMLSVAGWRDWGRTGSCWSRAPPSGWCVMAASPRSVGSRGERTARTPGHPSIG